MVQSVNIRKGERIIRVNFMHNTDLISIMQSHKGWWFRKEKAWQFPLWKFESIYDELTDKRYNVIISKLEEKKKSTQYEQKVIDYWKLPDVVGVPGNCKKCKQYHILNKDGLCKECS